MEQSTWVDGKYDFLAIENYKKRVVSRALSWCRSMKDKLPEEEKIIERVKLITKVERMQMAHHRKMEAASNANHDPSQLSIFKKVENVNNIRKRPIETPEQVSKCIYGIIRRRLDFLGMVTPPKELNDFLRKPDFSNIFEYCAQRFDGDLSPYRGNVQCISEFLIDSNALRSKLAYLICDSLGEDFCAGIGSGFTLILDLCTTGGCSLYSSLPELHQDARCPVGFGILDQFPKCGNYKCRVCRDYKNTIEFKDGSKVYLCDDCKYLKQDIERVLFYREVEKGVFWDERTNKNVPYYKVRKMLHPHNYP